MRSKILYLVLLITVGWVLNASAQDEVFFYSGGERIYGNLAKQWIAIKLKSGRTIDEVKMKAGMVVDKSYSIPKELSLLEREGIIFLNIEDQLDTRENILKDMRADPGVKVVGQPLYLLRSEVPLILTDEFVVKFKPNVAQSQIEQFNSKNDVELVKESPHVKNKMVLRVTSTSGKNALQMANYYYESGLTEFSHPNFIVHTEERFTPDDPQYPQQWHLNNTGQRGGLDDADIDAEEAWDITTGSSDIIIAVIDSGVQIQHEDLEPNQFTNTLEIPDNGIDDDGNGYIDDVHGWNFYNDTGNTDRGGLSSHGTCVAGVAVARGDNGIGVSGVCPNCALLPIARGSTVDDHADSFDYAVSMGAHVITNSWGYWLNTPTTDVVVDAINNAAINGRGGLGCVITWAMTNENWDNCDPAQLDISALDNVIAISRADDHDELDNGGYGDCMELLAPTRGDTHGRAGLMTTDQTGSDGYNTLGDYHLDFGGTSGATPQVAGIAALMLTLDSSLTKDDVLTILIQTADKIDAENADYDPVTGFSETHGYGRVNAFNALFALINHPPNADANGPYDAECEGITTTVYLDGSGSSDPDPDDTLTYSWNTDCPGGSFDDETSVTPVLKVDTSDGCLVQCNVSLTVTDDAGDEDTATASVTILDIAPPVFSNVPGDVTVECDSVPEPASVAATDDCDQNPMVSFSEVRTEGSCPDNYTLTRTWTATDSCGNTSSGVQTIEVADTTPPLIECNAPAAITPPDAPIAFTVTATDNCDGDPSVEITEHACFKYTKKGKRIDKAESCVVNVVGDTITILDSGGVGDRITWIVRANDSCGNVTFHECGVDVVNPAQP